MLDIFKVTRWKNSLKIDKIVDFSGRGYKITTCGRLFNNKKELKGSVSNRGYKRVHLTDIDGKTHKISIHQLIAQYYLRDEMDEGLCVNHINEIKTDNYVQNLEWVTQEQNIKHGTRDVRAIANISKPMEYFETNAVTRGNFKRSCKSKSWNYNDFIEKFAEWHYFPNGIRGRKYFYFYNK